MKLSADIDLYAQGYQQGLIIPKDATVNLFLNNRTISYIIASGNEYLNHQIFGIINYGTLNVYAGSSKTPSSSDKGSIVIKTVRTDKKPDSGGNEIRYGRAEAIQNHGVLHIVH